MSDLLNKKTSNLLSPSSKIEPENTFDRNNLFTMENEEKKKSTPKVNKKRTSIGCFQHTANYISAIGTVLDTKNVDEVLEILINNYIPTMSKNDQSEIKTIKKILDRKNN